MSNETLVMKRLEPYVIGLTPKVAQCILDYSCINYTAPITDLIEAVQAYIQDSIISSSVSAHELSARTYKTIRVMTDGEGATVHLGLVNLSGRTGYTENTRSTVRKLLKRFRKNKQFTCGELTVARSILYGQ